MWKCKPGNRLPALCASPCCGQACWSTLKQGNVKPDYIWKKKSKKDHGAEALTKLSGAPLPVGPIFCHLLVAAAFGQSKEALEAKQAQRHLNSHFITHLGLGFFLF